MPEVVNPKRLAASWMRWRIGRSKRREMGTVFGIFLFTPLIVASCNTMSRIIFDFFQEEGYNARMSEGQPISVRFSREMIKRLDAAAKKTGIGARTALVKICVDSFLDYFERTGMAGLPLNYKEILHAMDGRVQRFGNPNIMSQHVIAHQVVNGGVINNHVPPAAKKRVGKTSPKKTSERQNGKP